LTAKVSDIASAVTKFMRVDRGDIPALFINKFNPCSPTIEDTSSATSLNVSWSNTSTKISNNKIYLKIQLQ
jgi:hypothetical protein